MPKLMQGYLTEEQLASELDRSVRTLKYWRKHRRGPPWTQIGYSVLYRRDSVVHWLQQQEIVPANARR